MEAPQLLAVKTHVHDRAYLFARYIVAPNDNHDSCPPNCTLTYCDQSNTAAMGDDITIHNKRASDTSYTGAVDTSYPLFRLCRQGFNDNG